MTDIPSPSPSRERKGDFATSADPAVQAQLDRLFAHGPGTDTLGLDRITRLLARLGDPHRALPPVLHVAGTNGKGSTCAFLRAALEAAKYRVHAYTSPHLVRFNERIRLAGRLIEDAALAPLLAEVLDAAEDLNASFFEVTTAATFLAFSRTPADACVIEVGLGGRLDATNVLAAPAVCGIAALGLDHQAWLGNTPEEVAREKAGIAKPGVPLVTMRYPPAVLEAIAEVTAAVRAPVLAQGDAWHLTQSGVEPDARGIMRRHSRYSDWQGVLSLPEPDLAGAHQIENHALAVAMLRHQDALAIPGAALIAAAHRVRWPARLQRLRDTGPLVRRLPAERRRYGVWLDGAHNPQAAAAIADRWTNGAATALIVGMLANKDAEGVLRQLTDTSAGCEVVAVPVPGHDHHAPDSLAALALNHGARRARTASSVAAAIGLLAADGMGESVLIAGSLYLAGEVLRLNDEPPE